MEMSVRITLPILLAVALAAAGCPKKSEGTADGDKPAAGGTGPVAKVNGQEISRGTFEKQMERTRARFQRAGRQIAPALETRLKENLLRKLVEEELIAQKAKAEGITLEPAEIDAKLTEHKARFGSDKAFQSFLDRTQQSEADVKDDLSKNLLRDKLFAKMLQGSEPTEADAQKYYEENKDKYKQKEQINAQHILFKMDKNTTDAEKKQKLDQAKKVFAEAKKKDADFGELAKKYSEGPTAQRGGDLGTFSRGRMVKQFEDVAFAAKPGEIVGPVETQFGYHIIKVNEKIEEKQRPYDEVKESILTSLKARQKSKATRELLDKLRAEAKIEVLEPGVSLDAKRAPVTAEGKPLPTGDLDPLREAAAKAAGDEGDKPEDGAEEEKKPE
jgi:peptidyl-prolyl cis-trans isomerase C